VLSRQRAQRKACNTEHEARRQPVYALPPVALAILYLYGRRDAADRFLMVVLLSVLLCYAKFPFWPSEPPRVVFAGLDLPTYNTIFRRLNLWILGNYGIHTSVFPSAHVAGALSTAFGIRLAMPEGKRAFRSLFVIAVLIAIATVYGRYHYLADASFGAIIACAVLFLVSARKTDEGSRQEKHAWNFCVWGDSGPVLPPKYPGAGAPRDGEPGGAGIEFARVNRHEIGTIEMHAIPPAWLAGDRFRKGQFVAEESVTLRDNAWYQ